MTDKKYEDSGSLFRNTYKQPGESTPDWRTKINISYDLLKSLVEDYKTGSEAKIEVAVWNPDRDPDRGYIKLQRPRVVEEKPANDLDVPF
jgi:hypothetical protein